MVGFYDLGLSLHSTMFLLILTKATLPDSLTTIFTFHNVSINTGESDCEGLREEFIFTFHNVSINTLHAGPALLV